MQDQQPDVMTPEDLSGALPEGQPPVQAPEVPQTPVRPTEPAIPWSSMPERTRKKVRASRRNRGVVEKADVAAPNRRSGSAVGRPMNSDSGIVGLRR